MESLEEYWIQGWRERVKNVSPIKPSWPALFTASSVPKPYLIRAVELELRVESVIQSRLLDDNPDLVFTVWREALRVTRESKSAY